MRYHILVVEDDAVTREKLTGYFEREGYRVTAVENGQEMRAVLAEQTVDLVMLDINLPGEDGLLLTRELRARSTVGIILVTGRSDAVDKIVGHRDGRRRLCHQAVRAAGVAGAGQESAVADLVGRRPE